MSLHTLVDKMRLKKFFFLLQNNDFDLIFGLQLVDLRLESDSQHFLLEGAHFLACFPDEDRNVLISSGKKVLWKPLKIAQNLNSCVEFIWIFFSHIIVTAKTFFFCLILNNFFYNFNSFLAY